MNQLTCRMLCVHRSRWLTDVKEKIITVSSGEITQPTYDKLFWPTLYVLIHTEIHKSSLACHNIFSLAKFRTSFVSQLF